MGRPFSFWMGTCLEMIGSFSLLIVLLLSLRVFALEYLLFWTSVTGVLLGFSLFTFLGRRTACLYLPLLGLNVASILHLFFELYGRHALGWIIVALVVKLMGSAVTAGLTPWVLHPQQGDKVVGACPQPPGGWLFLWFVVCVPWVFSYSIMTLVGDSSFTVRLLQLLWWLSITGLGYSASFGYYLLLL